MECKDPRETQVSQGDQVQEDDQVPPGSMECEKLDPMDRRQLAQDRRVQQDPLEIQETVDPPGNQDRQGRQVPLALTSQQEPQDSQVPRDGPDAQDPQDVSQKEPLERCRLRSIKWAPSTQERRRSRLAWGNTPCCSEYRLQPSLLLRCR